MNEQAAQANPMPKCDHICLKDDGHVERGEPHFHGYELPSPRVELRRAQAETAALVGALLFMGVTREWIDEALAIAHEEAS